MSAQPLGISLRSCTWLVLAGGFSALVGCDSPPRAEIVEPPPTASPEERAEAASRAEAEARQQVIDTEFPLHGAITAPQIAVRSEANPEAQVVGWLRLGGRVRLGTERVQTPTCSTGWYAVHPRGWACAGLGIDVAEEAPPEQQEGAANVESPLPYRYMLVREPQVPEYHQPPSREVQRAAQEHGQRYAELLNSDQERRANLLREGRLAGEPARPNAVRRYLHRNFYVASNGTETRASRRFARTVRGTYVQEAQLLERTGSEFAGVEIDEENPLPIAWAVRESQPLRNLVAFDGSPRLRSEPALEPYARHERLPWLRRDHVGDHIVHVLDTDEGERYLRAWFAAVAELHAPPEDVGVDEPWVHVDVSEQSLVVYRGTTPLYATLVSSGLDGHDTPRGSFRIRRKFISDTMANLGPDAGDDSYRIDDVPWTQYFEGSFALHGAFWHNRFGLQRSHGCVNLAPRDARWVFEHTWPEIPDGWHGVSTERGAGFEGSVVLVTD
ncbi:MAG: L,D-transpeptidase [Sandaracinaceae bacterium]